MCVTALCLLILFNYLPLPLPEKALPFSLRSIFFHPSLLAVFSAVGRSGIHIQPLLSEHWGVEVQRHSTDHNGWPIICSKGGGGLLGGVGDYGWKRSIYQSISNEGKNWSNSSRWKSCSAWGGLSALCQQGINSQSCFCATAPLQGSDCNHTGSLFTTCAVIFVASMGL